MRKLDIRIGDCVGLMQQGDIRTAHVVWKGRKSVKIRYCIGHEYRSVSYDDIICVITPQDSPLEDLYDDLPSQHICALRFAHTKLAEYNLPDWDIQLDEQAYSRGGQCGYSRKTISLTFSFITHASIEEVEDTILHEIAHALVGPTHDHDRVWRAKALAIGCNGKRTHDVHMPKRWIKYCPNNHFVATTNRRSLKRKRTCNQCGAYTQYERYADDRYEELRKDMV